MVKIIDYGFKVYDDIEGNKGLDIIRKIEYCGRTCYKSVNKNGLEDTKRFVGNLIKNGHTSVLEHQSITVEFTADVGFYKDLTRHRAGTAFSIESTRFCNYSRDKFGGEIQVMNPFFINNQQREIWEASMISMEKYYKELGEADATNDIKRMILPHSTKATVMMTANLRAWRHILNIRTKKNVHPSISRLLTSLLVYFQANIPVVFDDIISEVEPLDLGDRKCEKIA